MRSFQSSSAPGTREARGSWASSLLLCCRLRYSYKLYYITTLLFHSIQHTQTLHRAYRMVMSTAPAIGVETYSSLITTSYDPSDQTDQANFLAALLDDLYFQHIDIDISVAFWYGIIIVSTIFGVINVYLKTITYLRCVSTWIDWNNNDRLRLDYEQLQREQHPTQRLQIIYSQNLWLG